MSNTDKIAELKEADLEAEEIAGLGDNYFFEGVAYYV